MSLSPNCPQYSPKMSSPSPPQFLGNFGEFSPKIPRNSPKIGVGTGKTYLGNIGDNLGTGTKLVNSPNFPKIPQSLFYKELGTLVLLIKYWFFIHSFRWIKRFNNTGRIWTHAYIQQNKTPQKSLTNRGMDPIFFGWKPRDKSIM